SVPEDLDDIIVAVLGFDDRPAARPHVRFLDGPPARRGAKATGAAKGGKRAGGKKAGDKGAGGRKATAHNAPDGSFTPPEIAKLYDSPAGLDGAGQCIAIVELNDFDASHKPTGSGFSLADLKAYFTSLGLPTPDVTAVGVSSNGGVGANVPGPDPDA